MSKNRNLSGNRFAARETPLINRETPLSAQIAEWLDGRGLWNERLNCGKIKIENGRPIDLCERETPDRITIIRGQTIFIETQRFGEKPSSHQQTKHAALRASGAILIVADSFHQFVAHFEAIRAAIENSARKGEINLYD